MSDFISGTVEANGISIHYHRTGGDKVPIVVAHGVTDNGISWLPVARALAPAYDVILYDQRGHGLSQAPPQGYSFSDHAADLAGLIQILGLDKPHLIGHSGGAVTVSLLAAQKPEIVRSLILEEPAWGTGWGGWEATKEGLRNWFVNLGQQNQQQLTAVCRGENPGWSDEEVSLWVDSKLQVHANVSQMFTQPATNWHQLMERIHCPILLLTGDPQHGAIFTSHDIQAINTIWNQGRVQQIEGAGHMIHYDAFPAFIQETRTFLHELDHG